MKPINCGSNAGSIIEPFLWNARESVWISSPWIGKEYAKRLASLSQRGIKVRIITSDDDKNESLEVFRASGNSNLELRVSEKRSTFVHSKIYIVDNARAISGSANLTPSGLYFNHESICMTETRMETRQIEEDFTEAFTRISKTFEAKGIPTEELSSDKRALSATSYSIRGALSLLKNFGDINEPNTIGKELVYRPYYFLEWSFRTSVGRSPSTPFENNGKVVLDATTRQIVKDNKILGQIFNYSTENYVLETDNKYRLTIHSPIVHNLREAEELVKDRIVEENTQHYTQYYGSGIYDGTFAPYRNIIRFTPRSGLVQVPVWYIDKCEPNGRKYQDVIFGSGRPWNQFVYCPECQMKNWTDQMISCERCGKKVCPSCIKEKGLFFVKKLCSSCYHS